MRAISIEEHKLKGTRPTRAASGAPSEAGRPRMPKHLSESAQRVWKETLRLLRRRGTLTADTGPTLAIYAECVATWEVAKADIIARGQIISETRFSKSGTEYQIDVVNPSMKIKENCERQALAVLKALGLSPDAREKVKKARTKADMPGGAFAKRYGLG
jgi:P27 family predicted phage terminase small subunit